MRDRIEDMVKDNYKDFVKAIISIVFILAEMYRRSGGTDTAVPVEVYRQTGTGYRLHHSG